MVPNLLQGHVCFWNGRKGGQTVGDQVTEQIRQGFAAALCLRYEHLVVAFLDPNRIGHGLHVFNLTTMKLPSRAIFHASRSGGVGQRPVREWGFHYGGQEGFDLPVTYLVPRCSRCNTMVLLRRCLSLTPNFSSLKRRAIFLSPFWTGRSGISQWH